MAKRVLHGPSAHVFGTDKRPKLLSPDLELPSFTSSHIEPSEAADPSPDPPALRQDVSLTLPPADFDSFTGDLDDFLRSSPSADDLYLLLMDNPEPSLNTDVEHFWTCNPELQPEQTRGPTPLVPSPGAPPHRVTDTEDLERPTYSTELLECVQERRSVVNEELTTPIAEQSAPERHKRTSRALMSDQQPSASLLQPAEPPGPIAPTTAMDEQVRKPKRSLQCSFRKAQAKLGLPYTCTAAPVATVSAVRTHLTRKLAEKKPPHLPFLKLCRTCNDEILDESEFENFHGKDGLRCETPRQQRKGDAGQQEQYDILCSKVEAYIIAQGTQPTVSAYDTIQSPRISQVQAAPAQEQSNSPTSIEHPMVLATANQNAEQGPDLIAESNSPSLTDTVRQEAIPPNRSASDKDVRMNILWRSPVILDWPLMKSRPQRRTSIDRPNPGPNFKESAKANFASSTTTQPTVRKSRYPHWGALQETSKTVAQNSTQIPKQQSEHRLQSSNATRSTAFSGAAVTSSPHKQTDIDTAGSMAPKLCRDPLYESRPRSSQDPAWPCNREYPYDDAISEDIELAGAVLQDTNLGLPDAEFAFNLWPPSIYEAAQYAYPASLPLRHTTPSWPWSVYEAAQNSSPAPTAPSPTISSDYPSQNGARENDHDGESAGLNIEKERNQNRARPQKVTLRCLLCVDGPEFTGQYAQRNLNRHMEKHKTIGQSRGTRHIRCGQPGCASTFLREDALLVHLRRSHPELDTPPPKKRKRDG